MASPEPPPSSPALATSSSSSSSSPSIASVTGEGDIAVKFQRLLAEYDKIKKQHTILKKAVLAVRRCPRARASLASVVVDSLSLCTCVSRVQEQAKNKDLEVKAKEQEVRHRATEPLSHRSSLRAPRRRCHGVAPRLTRHVHDGGGWAGSQVKLRRSMEDNELLSFNNQRLTKRIAQMQQQLHEVRRLVLVLVLSLACTGEF